jgi:very-short-patch-repair endonuclease
MWKYLRAGLLHGFQFNRQKPLGKFIADFYCKKLNLVIEIDGPSHEEKEHYDKNRDAELQKLGLQILHFSDLEVKQNISNVLLRTVDWIIQNSKNINPPIPLFIKGEELHSCYFF